MNKSGPVIIVDNDEDDLMIMKDLFLDFNLPNEILAFTSSDEMIEFTDKQPGFSPFLIVSDLNLAHTGGFELRKKMRSHKNYLLRCTPFLFFTTSKGINDIRDAYEDGIQGIFIKPADLRVMKKMVGALIEYWTCAEELQEHQH